MPAVRLQRLLASAGLCSRREAERWIEAGRVRVNGRPATLGQGADPGQDEITVDGRPLVPDAPLYWMAHKPRGLLSTRRDPEGRPTVLSLLPRGLPRLFPVGRLDADTEGLVLLTNDGALAHRLLHPSLGNEREYRVTVRGEPSEETFRKLSRGIDLEDGRTAPTRISGVRRDRKADEARFDLVMIEGRKRQIRRMLAAVGHPVRSLLRIRMGTLRLGDLPLGAARPLSAEELRRLSRHAARLAAAPGDPGPPRGRGSPRR